MKQLVVLGLSLTLTVAQLLPFCILPTSLFLKLVNIEKNIEDYGNAEGIDTSTENNVSSEVSKVKVTIPNYTLELEGYGTFGFHSSYFSVVDSLTTNVKKTIRYKDNKSKITVSYITGLSSDIDIPGYITREVAGVDTVTNDKYRLDVFGKEWMIVPSKNQVDGMNVYVCYLLSKSSTHAIWMRIDVDPSVDNDVELNFKDDILFRMLESVNVYYIGDTVFDTPTGGYYADKEDSGDGTSGDTEGWESNDDDNNVYQPTQGFVNADISKNWDSLEVIIKGKKLKVPCTVTELNNLGFVIDDSSNMGLEDVISAGASVELTATNKGNAYININVFNDSNSEDKKVKDCRISSIDIDLSNFKYIADMSQDYIILPGGITTEVYTDDIVKTYGTPTKNESIQDNGSITKKLTWQLGSKRVTIYSGVVAYITRIEIDSNS